MSAKESCLYGIIGIRITPVSYTHLLAHATYENPVWVELDRGVIPENEIIDEMVKVAPQYEADIRR